MLLILVRLDAMSVCVLTAGDGGVYDVGISVGVGCVYNCIRID